MGKRPRPQKTIKAAQPEPALQAISAVGRRFIAAGAVCVVLGFLALTQADPMGRNWACDVCAPLLLGGYALIGVGLFAPPAGGGEPSAPLS